MKLIAIVCVVSAGTLVVPAIASGSAWARTSAGNALPPTPHVSMHVSLSKTPRFSRTTPDIVPVGRLSLAHDRAEHWHSYGVRSPHALQFGH